MTGSGQTRTSAAGCPLYLKEQTCSDHSGMSVWGQQQSFDHFVGELLQLWSYLDPERSGSL